MTKTTSEKPGKQRRAQANQPHHRRRKRLNAHLAEDLLIRYDRRSLTVREGDTVEVMRGSYAGTEGKVMGVDHTRGLLTVEGVTVTKSDGTEAPKWIQPSNVKLTKLDLSDRLRREHLGRKAEEAWEEEVVEEEEAAEEAGLEAEEGAADLEEEGAIEEGEAADGDLEETEAPADDEAEEAESVADDGPAAPAGGEEE